MTLCKTSTSISSRLPTVDELRLVVKQRLDFFEEGVAAGKGVLELIGTDVAAFCDDLIKESRTYADMVQESIRDEK